MVSVIVEKGNPMIDREKLVMLLHNVGRNVMIYKTDDFIESLADYLISNGVTIIDCNKDCVNCWKTKLVNPVQQSVPVTARKQGYWIYHTDDLFPAESTQECFMCHEHESITLYNENFCPNCGAKMKGKYK